MNRFYSLILGYGVKNELQTLALDILNYILFLFLETQNKCACLIILTHARRYGSMPPSLYVHARMTHASTYYCERLQRILRLAKPSPPLVVDIHVHITERTN